MKIIYLMTQGMGAGEEVLLREGLLMKKAKIAAQLPS